MENKIKLEDPTDEPELLSDPEDYLEKDESLDMNLTNGNQRVWLVRIPKYLAEQWSKESMIGKQLGTVKIKRGNNRENTGNRNQIKLMLNKELQDDSIPAEYNLSVTNTQVRNSYVFSEENLKRFKAENTEISENRPKEEEDEFKPRFDYQNDGYNNGPHDIAPPPIKTIPKKTALLGKIVHECQLRSEQPDLTMRSFNSKNTILADKARPKVVFLDEIPGVTHAAAGPSIKGKSTSIFLKSHNKVKTDGRAIRMPKKDLLDLLFRLFDEYEYWSIKGLRERTRQPESYLKESLESIANLIKKGPYASRYNLKPEYKKLKDAERAAKAGSQIDNNINDEDEDDNDMEDVI